MAKAPVFDWAAYESRLDAIIKQSFSSSFMSNSRWRRLFEVLNRPELELDQLVWKFVDNEREFHSPPPAANDLTESTVTDYFVNEFPYKAIEWVEVPTASIPYGWKQVPQKHRTQDIDRVVGALTAIGQFEMERRDRGVRIYGWR